MERETPYLSPKVAGAWLERNEFTVQRYALFQAVRELPKIKALQLIRDAFMTDGERPSLADALKLLEMIEKEH